MDERSASRYTCKTLMEAWNKKALRANFKSSTGSLLEWLFNYAPNPFDSLFDLLEEFIAESESNSAEEAVRIILEKFDTWYRDQQQTNQHSEQQSLEQITAKHLSRSEDMARAVKLFGRYRREMLPLLSLCQVKSGNSQRLEDAAYSVFSHFLGARRHDDALAVFHDFGDNFRPTIAERHATHLALYLLCSGKRADATKLFELCAQKQRSAILNFLDSLLIFTDREFEREALCCSGTKLQLTKAEFEEFLENLLNTLSLSISQCPSLQMRAKIKLFRFLTEKAINNSEPQTDLPSFCEMVAELGENDTNFQDHVVRVLKSLGQFDLAHYFSRDCFAALKRSSSSSGQSSSKKSRTDSGNHQRPPPPPPPPLLAALSHKKPSSRQKEQRSPRKMFELSLDDSKIVLVNQVDHFRSVIDQLASSSLVAFRLFWRRRIPDKTNRTIALSLLAVAIPNQVYLLDLTRLPQLLENDQRGGFLFWLRDILECDKMTRLVFRPNEDLRTLQRELFANSESPIQHFTMSSLRDLAVFVDPKRHRRSTLPSLARRWLNANLPLNYRFTNWLRRPLSREQMRHAAMECHVLLEIYRSMSYYCSRNKVDFLSLRRLTLKAVDDGSSMESEEDESESSSDSENNEDLFPPPETSNNNNLLIVNTNHISNSPHRALPPSVSPSISSFVNNPSSKNPIFTVTCSLPVPLSSNSSSFLSPPLFEFDQNNVNNGLNNSNGVDLSPFSGGDFSSQPTLSLKKSISNPLALVPISSSSSSSSKEKPSAKAERPGKSDHIYFLVAHEFCELAIELVRIGFCVQLLSRLEGASFASLVSVSAAKGDIRRVVLGRRELIDKVDAEPVKDGFSYEGLVVSAITFEETGRAVSSILHDLEIPPRLIDARFSRTPKYPGPKDSPLVVFYPRDYFPRLLRERLRPKIYICPVPTGDNLSDDQLAVMGGLGAPNANRIFMMDSPNGERLKQRYGSNLRILIVPKMYIHGRELDKLTAVIVDQVKEFSRESRNIRPSSSSSSHSLTNKSKNQVLAPVKSVPSLNSNSNLTVINTKSPLAKFSLLCCVDSVVSQLIEYLEMIGFSCSRVVAANIPFRRAIEMSKAGKKLLIASEMYATNDVTAPGDDFILVKNDGRLLSAIYAIAKRLSCSEIVDSRLNFVVEREKIVLPCKVVVYSNLHRSTYDLLAQLTPLVSPIFYDSTQTKVEKVIEVASKEKRVLVTDSKITFSSPQLSFRTNFKTDISFISLCPDSVVEEAKYIFRQLGIDSCALVPENLREPLKQMIFIVHAVDAIKVGSYLQLAGAFSVSTEHTSLAFTDVCKIAKREGAIILAKRSEANRLFLTQKSDTSAMIPPDRVIFLQLPGPSLSDLLKTVFDHLANLATATSPTVKQESV